MKKLTVLIPCHNEEKGIGAVIDGIPTAKLLASGISTDIIVIDNNSTDKTAMVCRRKKVRLIREKKMGKGNAIKTGFGAVSKDTDYVVMLDGDNTYKGNEIPRLIEPLENGFCDVIVGTRLGGKIHKNALKAQNRIVNWMFTFMVRHFYKANVTDVLCGFFAWKKSVVDELSVHLESDKFEIEMEMITKMVKMGYSMYSVPITYDIRRGETKIESLKDGLHILTTFFRFLFWKPGRIEQSRDSIVAAPSYYNS